ncbi:MAG: transcription antitermination factor NusB [Eubacteriales bacterium]|nr:transcription antitermination factor NusB [Bacillota bacterium]MBV1727271.1 transcription antitermination factor NusB [Desulforudis sp.]MDP3050337.1 transcription antitermination factor NusB [Eubacteriales bacterium]MBU4554592.1 transcription antitermination factor NusB [Bacillota bacterium]MBV1735181.1 transcription antitermination factor NusB [Desulforudis sp.]
MIKVSRRQARDFALQVLFQVDLTAQTLDQAFQGTAEFHSLDPAHYQFGLELAQGVLEHLRELDEAAANLSKDWSVSRMPVIDRNLIRMGLYEIKYCPDIPHNVSINEVVELGKIYGTDNTPRFINGILGNYVKDKDGTV